MLDRWDEIIAVLQTILGGCAGACEASCYRCMRTGRNVFWHRLLGRAVALEVVGRMSDKPRYSHELAAQQDETFGGRPRSTNDAEDRMVEILERQGLDGFAKGQHQIDLPAPLTARAPTSPGPISTSRCTSTGCPRTSTAAPRERDPTSFFVMPSRTWGGRSS